MNIAVRRRSASFLLDVVNVPVLTPSGTVAVVHKTLCPVCADRLLPEASMLSPTQGPVTYYADGWKWFRRKRPVTCSMCGSQLPADLSNLFYRLPTHSEVLGLCHSCASRVVRAEVVGQPRTASAQRTSRKPMKKAHPGIPDGPHIARG